MTSLSSLLKTVISNKLDSKDGHYLNSNNYSIKVKKTSESLDLI